MLAVRMLLISLFIFCISGAGLAQAAPGKIEEVAVGSLVKVSRAGTIVRLKKGDPLQSGDEVTTDANTAVDIRLEDETLIRIGISSTYRIQEDSKINTLIHRLLSGAVRVLVPKSEVKSSLVKFRLFTPEGTIGVRGTEFVVLRSEGKTQLKGLDGNVMFGPAEADFSNDSVFVSVGRGYSSTVLAGGKPAAKPEKFDLPKYKSELDSKSGLFGPLAARVEGSNTHLRADNSSVSKPEPALKVAAAPAPKVQEPKENVGTKPAGNGINYQKMLLDGALNGRLNDVKEALENGANINDVDMLKHSALQIALMEKDDQSKEIFLHLVASGANLDVLDERGDTPLMYIARNRLDIEYAKALVEEGGARLDMKDRKGLLVDEVAEAAGYEELHTYLTDPATLTANTAAVKQRAVREKRAEAERVQKMKEEAKRKK